MSIKTEARDNKHFVFFPFELKDNFRATFPSTKWNPEARAWVVGPRTKKRLDQWIAIVRDSGVVESLAARDTAELQSKEISELEFELSRLRKEIDIESGSLSEQTDRAARIQALRKELEAEQDRLAEIKMERANAQQKADKEKALMTEIVDGVIDLSEVHVQLSIMRKNMGIQKAYASQNYKDAAARLSELYEELTDSGIECEGISTALNANKNRPDRDSSMLSQELIFELLENDCE